MRPSTDIFLQDAKSYNYTLTDRVIFCNNLPGFCITLPWSSLKCHIYRVCPVRLRTVVYSHIVIYHKNVGNKLNEHYQQALSVPVL